MNRCFKRIVSAFICAALCAGFLCLGAGAQNDEIKIFSAKQLTEIEQNPDASYILCDDINMEGIEWIPFAFGGSFNGNGHTIYNLSITNTSAQTSKTIDGNWKSYDTCFAALFSDATGAKITDVDILNLNINVTSEQNCFAAGICGLIDGTEISNCSVNGRIYLTSGGAIGGVGGIAGFGNGTITDCTAKVTAVFADTDKQNPCEEFCGGILACGCGVISNCKPTIIGYTSVYGYVHNGGVVGMYHKDKDSSQTGKWSVTGCTVKGSFEFFEKTESRRAYCEPIIGEALCNGLVCSDNTTVSFTKSESEDYDTYLYPEKCKKPKYSTSLTVSTCTEFGYTTYTCKTCGYSYTDNYVAPAHVSGKWQILSEATEEVDGEAVAYCTLCGRESERVAIPHDASVLLDGEEVENINLNYKQTVLVDTNIVADNQVVWWSSDESVAFVDYYGNVTATGSGEATIYCTTIDALQTAGCTVTVKYTWWQWLIKTVLLGFLWY